MTSEKPHQFHIPVMGLGYTIDCPLKVARFGISSVISIIEDELVEEMRRHHCEANHLEYHEIKSGTEDVRAKRITSYLNLIKHLVEEQLEKLLAEKFETGSDIDKYFELLPDKSERKLLYQSMVKTNDPEIKKQLQDRLRNNIVAGSIDVNIMAKADKLNYDSAGKELPREFSDALSALRGFANSDLQSSVVLSAGYNPILYNYLESFKDFFPDLDGHLKKKIILKVSDYRSAIIQGKILAKKGIWVSEFRVESGLNCGGHAFATEGKLLGPILEEFKNNKSALRVELLDLCNKSLRDKSAPILSNDSKIVLTVQGGIGTAAENKFLLEYYEADSTGWGSPFLLVPEATNVDESTLNALANARKEDYYLSNSSPLGIPIHSFRKSTSELQRLTRIEKGRPGSPCYKKYLSTNTEFTEKPICTASREYQNLKIKQLQSFEYDQENYDQAYQKIIEKDCLCEGLGESSRIKNDIDSKHKLTAVAICPGPNLAYFRGTYSLKEMVDHIYGRVNLLGSIKRSNMFVNELNLYIDQLKKEFGEYKDKVNKNQFRHLQNFKTNLIDGIDYYKQLVSEFHHESKSSIDAFLNEMDIILSKLCAYSIPELNENMA